MPTPVAHRVQKRRDTLRAAGLRPVQIWVPDTRRPGFAEECRRQARVVATADAADGDLGAFIDAALRDLADQSLDLGVKRGDLVTIAMPGDFGKPRPALVIQSDTFDETGTVTVLLMSGTLVDAPLIRQTIEPTPANGLRKRSQVMVDKAMSVKRDRIGATIGRLDPEPMLAVTRALAVFFAIA